MSIPSFQQPPVSAPSSHRLLSIDALRGWVMVIMLLDHVRETFFLHHQVGDPMNVADTDPVLFFSRLIAHVCAPVFVLLTGMSAWLYGQKAATVANLGRGVATAGATTAGAATAGAASAGAASAAAASAAAASTFLFKRGLFLVLLEVTIVNFAWTLSFPPSVVYLQVIWVIGLSMMALAALVWLPRPALLVVGAALVLGHNLLDGVHFESGHPMYVLWSILHDRGWIDVGDAMRLRTSYPLLPWIGVIALGYGIGPWFGASVSPAQRRNRLLGWGLTAVAAFVVLRAINGYGQAQKWAVGEDTLMSVMSFVNITKYPPSLLFLLLTLGIGLCMLAWLERVQSSRMVSVLCAFGAAPMFFYVFHLYVLKLLYEIGLRIWGLNQGDYLGVPTMGWIWVITVVLAMVLYRPVRAFGLLKARRRDVAWLKYL